MIADEEVERLGSMGLQALRALWRARFGEAPGLRSPALLRRLLAWRLQVRPGDPQLAQLREALGACARAKVPTGAVLAREWKGVRYEVEITDQGVVYKGQSYDSLSSVARQITGVRWNGPRFFGLRQEPPQ